LALGGAPVEGDSVPIVTALGTFRSFVTTSRWRTLARATCALEAEFDAALGIASIAILVAAIVATFIGIGNAVAAKKHPHAGNARRATAVAGFNEIAFGGTAVTRRLIAVVTGFTRPKNAVAAHDLRYARRAFVRTRMKWLNLADPRTAVPGHAVGVIAILGCLILVTVTAPRV
jgi:amino acid transporter